MGFLKLGLENKFSIEYQMTTMQMFFLMIWWKSKLDYFINL